MKKEYNKPEAIIVEIRSTQMMASSTPQSYNDRIVVIDDDTQLSADEYLVW